jgi:hypothetical protein
MQETDVAHELEPAHVTLHRLLATLPVVLLQAAGPLRLGGRAMLLLDAHQPPGAHEQLPAGL